MTALLTAKGNKGGGNWFSRSLLSSAAAAPALLSSPRLTDGAGHWASPLRLAATMGEHASVCPEPLRYGCTPTTPVRLWDPPDREIGCSMMREVMKAKDKPFTLSWL